MNSFFSVIVERQTAETIERRAVLRPTILRSFFYKRGSVFSSGVKTIATFEPYHWIVPYCIVHITYSVSASFFFLTVASIQRLYNGEWNENFLLTATVHVHIYVYAYTCICTRTCMHITDIHEYTWMYTYMYTVGDVHVCMCTYNYNNIIMK